MHEHLIALACLYKSDVIHHEPPTSSSSSRLAFATLACPRSSSRRTTVRGHPGLDGAEGIISGSTTPRTCRVWESRCIRWPRVLHHIITRATCLCLIPATKPPRLSDHEGSKFMTGFIAMCLKEFPGEVVRALCLTAKVTDRHLQLATAE